MILSKKPLALAQVEQYVPKDEKSQTMHDYLKAFKKLSKDKAESLIEEVTALNNPKLKEESIIKIADFLPKDAEDLNKVLNEVSLNEEESKTILSIVSKY